MSFLRNLSPLRAYRDLRGFLAQRHPAEFGFLVLAMAITGFFIFAFAKDSHVEREYRPNIIYVQQWPANRTDAQIIAQQKIDQVQIDKDKAELAARQKKLQNEFKKLDDGMKKYGL